MEFFFFLFFSFFLYVSMCRTERKMKNEMLQAHRRQRQQAVSRYDEQRTNKCVENI